MNTKSNKPATWAERLATMICVPLIIFSSVSILFPSFPPPLSSTYTQAREKGGDSTQLWMCHRQRRHRTPNSLQHQTEEITTAKQQSIAPRLHQTQVLPINHHNPCKTQIDRGSQKYRPNRQQYQIHRKILIEERIKVHLHSSYIVNDLQGQAQEGSEEEPGGAAVEC
jgi:hypothetical protein